MISDSYTPQHRVMEIPGEWGPRFDEIFCMIVDWRSRAEQDPREPDPDSSLAADDTAFPRMPTSRIAYNGLATAIEYLDFFRTSLTGAGTVYPTAHYTVLRTALMGAAQALWVLASPSDLRRQRALRIVIDDCNQERKFFNNLGDDLTSEEQTAVNDKLAALDKRLNEAATAAADLGMNIPNIAKLTVNTTEMITEAATLAFPPDRIENRQIRDSVAILWRSASGHLDASPQRVLLRLGAAPIELPAPLADLACTVLANRKGHATIGPLTPSSWLFPGGQPGRPISTAQLTYRLNNLGVRPNQARSTALLQLATEIPAAILARTLGIHADVAAAWQRHSAGDWTAYAAEVSRRDQQKREER